MYNLCANVQIIAGPLFKLSSQFNRCGLISVDPGCELLQDLALPYPSCCPRMRCNLPLDYDIMNDKSDNMQSEEMEGASNEIEKSR